MKFSLKLIIPLGPAVSNSLHHEGASIGTPLQALWTLLSSRSTGQTASI